jgi:hypothetical protein
MRSTDSKWDRYQPAHYLSVNTVDPDMDLDGSHEFFDHDDEYYGLTIVEPKGVLATARFLNGYDVL